MILNSSSKQGKWFQKFNGAFWFVLLTKFALESYHQLQLAFEQVRARRRGEKR